MNPFRPKNGVLHTYLPTLSAFEYKNGEFDAEYPNILLFIAGLGDGISSVPYLDELSSALGKLDKNGKWTVVQALISSSYSGFGTGSLSRDAFELSKLVKYLRSKEGGERKKIVLMGHSTGCQDTMEYLTKVMSSNLDDIDVLLDGAILQAPVSDREGQILFHGQDKIDRLVDKCEKEYINKGLKNHVLPEEFRGIATVPITAYRFYSLLKERGDDDYFSTYLVEKDLLKTFGQVRTPLLVLYGSKDEFRIPSLDIAGLLKKWQSVCPEEYWSPLSKVLEGATHKVDSNSDKGAKEDLIATVLEFIKSL